MKNKTILLVVAGIVLLGLIALGWFLYQKNLQTEPAPPGYQACTAQCGNTAIACIRSGGTRTSCSNTAMSCINSCGNSTASSSAPQMAPAETLAPVQAPKGQLTPIFPKGFVLGSSIQILKSYSISYPSGGNQYTTEWNSSTSLPALYALYQKYFPANGWTIVRQKIATTSSASLYAVNASSSNVTVGMTANGRGSQATLTYFLK